MYASVDLGGTTIAAALAPGDGRMVAEKSIPTRSNEGPQAVLARIARLILELAAAAGEKPKAMGMGVPGLVDLERGRTRCSSRRDAGP
jgi:glucokinase